MGNRQSKKDQTISDTVQDDLLRNALARLTDSQYIRTVILGTGSVGKSTVFKSIIYSYNKRVVDSTDIHDVRHYSRMNAVQGILTLLQKTGELYQTSTFSDNEWKKLIEVIIKFRENTFEKEDDLDYAQMQQLAVAIDTIWNWDEIQRIFKDRLRRRYWFPENMDYWYNKIKYVMSEQYEPDIEDCLKVKMRTTGSINTRYTDDNGIEFEFVDVGGERSERKKWIHTLFDGVDCILYVCALNQFCLSMFEDESVIGLNENLLIWQEIANNKLINNAKLVVLLNKTDLFRQFLMYQPLTFCFGDEYKGRNYMDMHPNKTAAIKRVIIELMLKGIELNISDDVAGIVSMFCDGFMYQDWLDLVYKDGVEFIKHKFLSIVADVYIYEVSAIDLDQIKIVMDDVKCRLVQNL